MNTNPQTPNGTFSFQAVVRFEIDPETAASLLVESDPTKTVHDWMRSQNPSPKDPPWSGNAEELRAQLGKYLAEKKVDQARQLLPSTDARIVPF